jgi:hypothetical protein
MPWIQVKVGDATAGNEATLGLAAIEPTSYGSLRRRSTTVQRS